MNREDIIRMAREAGLVNWEATAYANELERFAELLAQHEREACAECGADGGHALYCVACAEKFVKREWVGLTDEETETLIHRFDGDPHTLLDEVNARLKEKNT